MTLWQFRFVGLPVMAFPVVIPFAKWQESANSDVMYSKSKN